MAARLTRALAAAAGNGRQPSRNALEAAFHSGGWSLGQRSELAQEARNLAKRRELLHRELEKRHGSALHASMEIDGESYRYAAQATAASAAETRRRLGAHAEPPVPTDAPSRCPSAPLIDHDNEVQRASRALFKPNCEPRHRRMMVELTPGIGKTCVYLGVMADFLGRVCSDNGRFFDIVVLGDDDVFEEFRKNLRRCPAAVNLSELVSYAERRGADGQVTFKRHVLSSWTGRRYEDTHAAELRGNAGLVQLRDINPGTPGDCAVATHMAVVDPHAPGAATAPPQKPHDFERFKDERRCGDDPYVWNGSRVIFMPYALAARWVVFSEAGVPAHEAAQHFDFVPEEDRAAFERDAAPMAWQDLAAKYRAPLAAVKLGNLHKYDPHGRTKVANGKYKQPRLQINAANTVIIVDECQNLATPSEWSYPNESTRRQAPALSEALWRLSGDPRTSPYIFAGTGTPNVGTNPESSICLLQILNGKTRATSFLPFLDAEHRQPIKDLAEFRAVLRQGNRPLFWRRPEERKSKYLIVNPRKFLEPESGFVSDMSESPQPFPLLLPAYSSARLPIFVSRWNSDPRYTYAEATEAVRACLPFAAPPRAATVHLPHEVPGAKKKAGKAGKAAGGAENFENDVAYRTFICAARKVDLDAQAMRIFKPVYSQPAAAENRLMLQDIVVDHVFTANSYFDAHFYPRPEPGQMPPVTRAVVPQQVLGQSAPRDLARAAFPSAQVRLGDGRDAPWDAWSVPSDAADAYLAALSRDPKSLPPPYDSCRWPELSLWAAPDLKSRRLQLDLIGLCRRLVEGYLADPDAVDPDLEDDLRESAARNSPKLVAAADDMFAEPEGRSFVAAALDRMGLAAPEAVPVYGKSFFFLNAQNRRDGEMKGFDDNHLLIVATFYLRARCRPYVQAKPRPARQHRIGWLDALRRRASPQHVPLLADLSEKSVFFDRHWAEWLKEQEAYAASGVPCFYALADPKMIEADRPPGPPYASGPVYARYAAYLAGDAQRLEFDDVLQLMGAPSLRSAVKTAINQDACSPRREPWLAPAGQSGVVAADGAHKAVDLKCVGFNLSFGPMPRGKRVQEMGRNWRSCSFQQLTDKVVDWQVHIRQMLLAPPPGYSGPHADLLLRDCLLDSFYEAQDEVQQYLRMITVSAGVGCSLWWQYSEWLRVFESYHAKHRNDTEWFYPRPGVDAAMSTPCLDKDALHRWAKRDAQTDAAASGFWRCSKLSRGTALHDRGHVVPSAVGAFFADDIVGRGDASCPGGTADHRCAAYSGATAPPEPRRRHGLQTLFRLGRNQAAKR